eukprot:COSAG02_NODE_13643_length_1367_cov_18.273533_1_plen_27_part_10
MGAKDEGANAVGTGPLYFLGGSQKACI